MGLTGPRVVFGESPGEMALNNPSDPFFPRGLPDTDARSSGSAGLPVLPGESRRRSLPPALAPMPDPVTLLKALRHHWLLALCLGTVCGGLAGAGAWRVVPKPKYTASALIEVKTQKPTLLGDPTQDTTDYKRFQATQLALLKSRLVLAAALAQPGVEDLPSVSAQDEPVEWLEEQIVAEFQAGSELMRLTMSGNRPVDLSILVNAVADSYLNQILTKDHNERDAKAALYKRLLEEYNDKLTRQRAALHKLAESVGSDDNQTLVLKQQFAIQQLANEKAELHTLHSDLKRARVELDVRLSDDANDPHPLDESVIEDAIARDSVVDHYRQRIAEFDEKIERARRLTRNDSDPSVVDLKRKKDANRRSLDARQAELRPKIEKQIRSQGSEPVDPVAALKTKIKILSETEKILEQGVERSEKEAQSFNRQTIDLKSMKDEIATGEETSRQLGKQLESLNVELKAPQRGRIVERADKPRLESARKRLAAIALAAMGVFSCTVLGVSWREYRLRKVDSPNEVTNGLGLRLVGTLPALPDSNRNGGAPEAARWQNLLIESIDAARTVLLRDCRSDDLRVVMITSASKGEGKSSLSSHLAISLARTGRRTLLADFDLRCPSAHRLFDVAAYPGVCELLRDEAEVEDVVIPVMADLDVIPAGRRDPLAVRSLAQDGLAGLVAQFKASYDYVVIDSAPVLPVADSLQVAQHVDAVVISVYQGVSRMPAVFAGFERLEALGVRILGVVVTGVTGDGHSGAYPYQEVETHS